MAVTFLEPGGDANFFALSATSTFWNFQGGSAVVATDFVHGGHKKSISYSGGGLLGPLNNSLTDVGSRFSFFVYFNVLPGGAATILYARQSASANRVYQIKITSGGVIQLFEATTQIGSNGPTLSTGQWYRISLAYTITSTTVNRFELFVNGISAVSVTNTTLTNVTATRFILGNPDVDGTLDLRTSDHFIDNSSSLVDTGNIWVTAKRPFSNGTTNGFTTQIGSGGSGYGTGHTPQINERPLSNTNGWSMIGAGSAVTEEYNIEGKSVGDIDISSATIIDWMGWVSCKSLAGETIQIILDGANNSQAITSTETLYKKVKGSSTYPSGTGADIGITTDTSLTTVSLYECGIVVAYIPAPIVTTLTAAQASFALTGFTSTFTRAWKSLSPTVGSFTLIGVSAAITSARRIVNNFGSFTFTGEASTLTSARKSVLNFGSFVLTAFNSIFKFDGSSTVWTRQTKSSAPTYTTQTKNSSSWTTQSKS